MDRRTLIAAAVLERARRAEERPERRVPVAEADLLPRAPLAVAALGRS